jgi:hypothetical protein
MNMPSELKQAVVQAEGRPVEVVDGADRYILIKAEMYERLMGVLDLSEPGPEEKMALLQAWGKRAGWEEPEAAVFDDLKPL